MTGSAIRCLLEVHSHDRRSLDPGAAPDIMFLEGTVCTEGEITVFGELIESAPAIDLLLAGGRRPSKALL